MSFITHCPNTWWSWLYPNTSFAIIRHRSWLPLLCAFRSSKFCFCLDNFHEFTDADRCSLTRQDSRWDGCVDQCFMERHLGFLFWLHLWSVDAPHGEAVQSDRQVRDQQISGTWRAFIGKCTRVYCFGQNRKMNWFVAGRAEEVLRLEILQHQHDSPSEIACRQRVR